MFEKINEELKKYEGLAYLSDEIKEYKKELDKIVNYGMVLIGPDSFKQGEAINIIKRFQEKGFELVDLRIKKLNRTEMENLFLPTSTCMKCGNLKWWMISDSAEQGYFCATLFYSKSANETISCLKQLNKFKGKSNPLDNKNGVIRYDFAAINVCLNLIHVPDSYGDFFKDTSPFFSTSEIMEIVKGHDNCQNGLKNKIFEAELLNCDNSKRIFEKVYYKTKYRMACLMSNKDLLLDFYRNQYELFKEELGREENYTLFLESLEKERKFLEKIEEKMWLMMKTISTKDSRYSLIDDLNIIRLLDIFSYPQKYRTYSRDIYKQLEGVGLYIEEFDKLILNTSLIQCKEV